MTTFERWFLQRLLAKQVRQGGHYTNIKELYSMIRAAAVKEFTEDNKPTIDTFLRDAFEGQP